MANTTKGTKPEPDRLVSPTQIAELLGVSRGFAYNLLLDGEFGEVVQVGRADSKQATPRVWQSKVREWIAARTMGAAR